MLEIPVPDSNTEVKQHCASVALERVINLGTLGAVGMVLNEC